MALATRCPHCTTAFRVASDQLKLRAGLVRCGTCKEIFNGIENLLRPDEDIVAATAATMPPERPIPEVSATLPIPKRERGDNTRFNDLIAEVDHPEDLRRGAAPGPAPAATPADHPDAGSRGYAVNYAPVRQASTPADSRPAIPAARWPTVPGIVPRLQAASGPDTAHPLPDDDAAQTATEHIEHADSDDGSRPVIYHFEDTPPIETLPVDVQSSTATSAVAEPDSESLWAALDDQAPVATAEPNGSDETDSPPWPLLDSALEADAAPTLAGRPAGDAPQHLQSHPGMPEATRDQAGEDAGDANDDGWPALDDVTTLDSAMPPSGLLRAAINNDSAAYNHAEQALEHGSDHDPHDHALTPRDPAPEAAPETGSGHAVALEDDDGLPDFVTREQRRRDSQRLLRPLLIVCSLLLGLALLGQAVYAGRTVLAANFPQARPLLDAACLQVGCSVGLPMQIESVSIESSDFQPVAGNRDLFQLSVLLRNRSSTVQAWPTIELSLTDATDKLVGRKVIAPREYLPAGQTAARGFSAGSEQSIRLTLELTRMKASGYRVYVFYP
ncbi:MAG: DUF3426 domain-containing protein [Herminiimonas sp.]|nr:DUF3426 domain-containing protein [Herminiimonas sp.]